MEERTRPSIVPPPVPAGHLPEPAVAEWRASESEIRETLSRTHPLRRAGLVLLGSATLFLLFLGISALLNNSGVFRTHPNDKVVYQMLLTDIALFIPAGVLWARGYRALRKILTPAHDSVAELHASVKVSFVDDLGVYGTDEGVLLVHEEWLIFEGLRSQFALRMEDTVARNHMQLDLSAGHSTAVFAANEALFQIRASGLRVGMQDRRTKATSTNLTQVHWILNQWPVGMAKPLDRPLLPPNTQSPELRPFPPQELWISSSLLLGSALGLIFFIAALWRDSSFIRSPFYAAWYAALMFTIFSAPPEYSFKMSLRGLARKRERLLRKGRSGLTIVPMGDAREQEARQRLGQARAEITTEDQESVSNRG